MRNGTSYRTLSFLLGGPLLVEIITATVLFFMLLAAARSGLPPRTIACIPTAFSAGYVLSAWLAGRWVKWHSGWRLVMGTVFLHAILGTVVLLTGSFPLHVALALVIGLVSGHYFAPFQVVMAHVRPFRTLAWTVAAYNVSWGSGGTAGPLLSGWLPQLGMPLVIGVFWSCAALHCAMAFMAKHAGMREHEEEHPSTRFTSTPATVRIGWIAGFSAALMHSGLMAVWPPYGARAGMTDRQIAAGAMAVWAMIPLLAPLAALLRRKMDRMTPLVIAYGVGAAGLLALPLAPNGFLMGVCLLVTGVMISLLFFHGVYYANADAASRMRSVSIFEAIVGSGTLAGPAIMGGLAWNDAASPRPYIAGALILSVSAWATRRHARRPAPEARLTCT